jgi:hypothetical protein
LLLISPEPPPWQRRMSLVFPAYCFALRWRGSLPSTFPTCSRPRNVIGSVCRLDQVVTIGNLDAPGEEVDEPFSVQLVQQPGHCTTNPK